MMSSSATERGQLYRGRERRKGDLMSEREREKWSDSDWKCSTSEGVGPVEKNQNMMKYIVHQKSKIKLQGSLEGQ